MMKFSFAALDRIDISRESLTRVASGIFSGSKSNPGPSKYLSNKYENESKRLDGEEKRNHSFLLSD